MRDRFAFWMYDTYPYVLGGTVTKVRASGLVETKEYGHGYTFLPTLVVRVKDGRRMKSELQRLEDEYRDAREKLLVDFKKRADAVMASATSVELK